MTVEQFANGAIGTFTNSPGTTGLSFVLTSGEGARFPTAGAGPFRVSAWPPGVEPHAANAEWVLIDSISSDTLTVNASGRGYEGSTARNIVAGWRIGLPALTAGQSAKVWRGRDYLVNGVMYPLTRAGIAAAITAANAAGGGRVQLCETGINLDGTSFAMKSNVHFVGIVGSRTQLIVPDGNTNHAMTAYGGTGASSAIDTNVAVGSRTIVLVAGSVAGKGLAAGDYIYVYDGGAAYCTQIVSIATETLTIADPAPMPFTSATGVVYKITTPLVNATVENIEFVHAGAAGASARAIDAQGNVGCTYRNIKTVDFDGATAGGGQYHSFGYNNSFEDIYDENSGCALQSAFQTFAQTKSNFRNIESQRAAGFGIQPICACYCTVNGLRGSHTNGRALKINRARYSAFGNLVGANALGANGTGLMISGGTDGCEFHGVVATDNAAGGITFAGNDGGDVNNVIDGLVARRNGTVDLLIGTGAEGNKITGLWDTWQDDGYAAGEGSNLKNGILQAHAGATVTDTTTETAIVSGRIPAALPGKNGKIRFSLSGQYLNSSGAGRSPTFRLKAGSTTLIEGALPSIAASATPHGILIEGEIIFRGALNSFSAWMRVTLTPIDDAASGVGSLVTALQAQGLVTATGSVDFASAQLVSVTVQHPTNTSTQTFTREGATLEVLPL